jgi:hypothetical protein
MIVDVKVITRVFLEERGFDGLVNTTRKCACVKSDLFPCRRDRVENCLPGRKEEVWTINDGRSPL